MKSKIIHSTWPFIIVCAIANLITGCATTDDPSATKTTSGTRAAPIPSKYRATDGRNVEIGKSYPSEGGLSFKDPHLDKCWVAQDFKFSGYDTLYIAPTMSTAKFHDDERAPHDIAKANLPVELSRVIDSKGLFPSIALKESDIKPGGRVLRLENTITEYSKGGGAARFFVGLYGGGQPVLRVLGKMTDGDKTVFSFEGRRSGVSAAARLGGGTLRDEDIQIDDIRSLALDLSDFMAAVAGKYEPR